MEDYQSMYSKLHENPKHFTGKSIRSGVPMIAKLVADTGAKRLLDYGCGKGRQYSELRVHEQWGGIWPYCYDVGVPEFQARPRGAFDGVICTDVMEHIAEPDVDAILTDIFSYVPPRRDGGQSFAFFWISCRPAKAKRLPDGRNVHLCVKDPAWWAERLKPFITEHITLSAHFEQDDIA